MTMEYVVFKGMDDILYTVQYSECGTRPYLHHFGRDNNGGYALYLPNDPCDLELFKDTLNLVLDEVIKKKREAKRG